MPNFHTVNFYHPKLPYSDGGCTFLWDADHENSKLIFTIKDKEKFFLSVHKKENKFLIKGEKISRPTHVVYLQEALSIYAKASKSHPIFSNITPASNRYKKRSIALKNIDFFVNEFDFTCKKEIILEIGFGSGRHLLYQAKQNPDKLIIGIEIHKPSIEQVVKQCDILELKNVFLIDCDAREFLEFLPSNRLEKIFVHFPIPWDKKPHRRVISQLFTAEVLRTLKVYGTLEIRTDSDMYFEESLNIFNSFKDVKIEFFTNKDLDVSSKYEDRWKKQNKNIYDIVLTNLFLHEETKPLNLLSFDKKLNLDKIKHNFTSKTYIEDDFFVHFETLHVGYENLIIKLAFGHKQRGEHSFIIINEKEAYYFPEKIYATHANKKAHKIIKEWLGGN